MLTLFQPFQIFMDYLSSGKGAQLRMNNKHAVENMIYKIQESECVNTGPI